MEAVTYKGPYYPIANTTIGDPRPIFSFDLSRAAVGTRLPPGCTSLNGYISVANDADGTGNYFVATGGADPLVLAGCGMLGYTKHGFITDISGNYTGSIYMDKSNNVSVYNNSIYINMYAGDKLRTPFTIYNAIPTGYTDIWHPLDLSPEFYVEHPKTVLHDGSNSISIWGDNGGNALSPAQTTGANQPILTDAGIDFDATNDYLSVIGIADLPTWTMFCLYKTTNAACGVFEFSNSTSKRLGFIITSTDAPGKIYVLYGSAKLRLSDDAGFNSGAWQFVLISYNDDNMPMVYLDNVGKALGGSVGAITAGAANRIMVGNYNSYSQTAGLDGLIKMAGIIPGVASEAERLALYNYAQELVN